jgi:AraC-like DNA-binding protein
VPNDAITMLSVARHPAMPGLEAVRGVGVAADIVRHAHAKLVVGCCLAGGRRIVSSAGEWIVSEGEGFIIPPGMAHACGPCGASAHSYLVVAVAPALLAVVGRGASTARQPVRSWRDGDALALLVRLADAICRGDAAASGLFCELAGMLDLRAVALPALHPATLRAKAVIDAAPEQPVSVAALARAAGVSPFHLERLFVRDLGVPLGEYALARRVRLAAAHIGAGEGLAAAALAAGFYDQSHLTRHFRRRMGVSPGKFCQETPQRGREDGGRRNDASSLWVSRP